MKKKEFLKRKARKFVEAQNKVMENGLTEEEHINFVKGFLEGILRDYETRIKKLAQDFVREEIKKKGKEKGWTFEEMLVREIEKLRMEAYAPPQPPVW